ncbi:MAG: DUF5329 domain-containing protein [Bdellovibrionales bacterium]|nr:DUF5329 domain-containing protein [Massilia sp.]
MKILILAAALIAASAASAATPEPARVEITHLLGAVEKSGCKFNRNGSWHDALAARKHLEKKFSYMDKRDLAPTAEVFIERGASTSSSSGKPYEMQCTGAKIVTSSEWLTAELKRYREKK